MGIPSIAVVVLALLGIGYYILESSGATDPGQTLGPPSSGNPFIDALAAAIAHAEGYYLPLSRPNRNNNPGDITDTGVGEVGKDSGGLDIFPDSNTGWNALYHKLSNIMNGGSNTYSPIMSITNFAYTWTGGDIINGNGATANWASTVASKLTASGFPATTDQTLQEVSA